MPWFTTVCPKHFSLGSYAPDPLHLQLQSQELATKEKRGILITVPIFSSCPTPCEKPRIPCSTLFSQLQPETGRWCAQKSHPSEFIPNILPQGGVGKAPIYVSKYLLTCIQTLKSPPELSLNGKLEEAEPVLFLLLWKRLETARLAAS